ncbi:MAG: acyltransferase [Treponema sp.]|nr:acyltransferase [Treponema sp.]
MNRLINLELLSKYRTQLMGIAMIWIIIFHYFPDMSGFIQSDTHIAAFVVKIIIYYLVGWGYGGVDIFLFLSGLGLYYSLSKDSGILTFYRRRMIRILPYYIPIMLVINLAMVSQGAPMAVLFFGVSTVGFWTNMFGYGGWEWYIPSIIALYAVTPFYYRVFKWKPLLSTAAACIAGAGLSGLVIFAGLNHLVIFTSRIPVYFIGLYIGYRIAEKQFDFSYKPVKIILMFLALITGFFCLYFFYINYPEQLQNLGLAWYPFALITLPLLMALCALMNRAPEREYRILNFIGSYSLVIYLVHQDIFNLFSGILPSLSNARILSVAVSFLLAFIIQKAVSFIISRVQVKTSKPD